MRSLLASIVSKPSSLRKLLWSAWMEWITLLVREDPHRKLRVSWPGAILPVLLVSSVANEKHRISWEDLVSSMSSWMDLKVSLTFSIGCQVVSCRALWGRKSKLPAGLVRWSANMMLTTSSGHQLKLKRSWLSDLSLPQSTCRVKTLWYWAVLMIAILTSRRSRHLWSWYRRSPLTAMATSITRHAYLICWSAVVVWQPSSTKATSMW